MDKITLSDLEVFYRVGVTDAERAKPQRLLVNLELEHNLASAAGADDLTKTIDYFAVSQRLLNFGEGRQWRLIETLACEIAAAILREFAPSSVTVEVKKFIIPETRYVAVQVRRP